MNAHRTLERIAVYVWAAPNTLLGLLAGIVVLCLGGRLRFVRGVAEFSGGLLGVVAGSVPRSIRFSAMTLGHVILGISEAELAAARDHEHVHVRQYQSWGPLFLFAYAGSSLWQFMNGRRAYRDNFFERQAYKIEESGALRPDLRGEQP
jgi:hypothetical protein